MNCELIFVGTELLLGDILNTNARYLSRKLAERGIGVLFQTVVGDNEARLRQALEIAFSRSDMVITTGGLGPTKDDLTKEVCAAYFHLPLLLHEESLAKMRRYFERRGITMPQTNEKQAYLPQNAVIFPNTNGTAPGCAIEQNGKVLLMLPGPPREMQAMFEQAAAPFLERFCDGVIVSHEVRTFGIGESAMAERVRDLLDLKNPTVAPYAKSGEALLRVTAKANAKEEAEALMQPVLQTIRFRLKDWIYGEDCPSMEAALVALLKEKGLTVAVSESATAGLVAKRITDTAGASEVFHCGFVTYSDEIKHRVLGVREETLRAYTAVSPETAAEMAQGTLRESGADLAASITGLAGPGKDELGRDAGLCYIAVTDGSHLWQKTVQTGHTEADCREYNRTVFATHVLNELRLSAAGLR